MSDSTRIYSVTDNATKKARLVDAGNPAQAVRHVAVKAYSVSVATPKEVAALVANGVAVERAGREEPATEPATEPAA